jgi:DNA-directed RNA polymerase I subunit RPA1
MTLNTFHLAGHGAENMTLGIPRLKEILMTTPTNIKTQNMTVYFHKHAIESMTRDEMETFAYKFKRIRLSDVTKEVKVSQYISADPSGDGFHRVYKVTLLFEPYERIRKYLGLSFNDLVKVFQDKFAILLMTEINKQLKKGSAGGAAAVDEDAKTTESKSTTSKSRSKRAKSGSEDEHGGKRGDEMIEEEESKLKNDSKKSEKKKRRDDDDDEDEAEDEDNGSEEYNSDIDGVQKKAKEVKGYDDQDEDMNEGEEAYEEQAGKGRAES